MLGSWVVAVWAVKSAVRALLWVVVAVTGLMVPVPAVLPREVAVVLAWLGWLVMSVLLWVAAMAATGLMVAVPVRAVVWSR